MKAKLLTGKIVRIGKAPAGFVATELHLSASDVGYMLSMFEAAPHLLHRHLRQMHARFPEHRAPLIIDMEPIEEGKECQN